MLGFSDLFAIINGPNGCCRRFGGILKGGRLWRSNSSECKKVSSPLDEPDLVKCTEQGDKRARAADAENLYALTNVSQCVRD